MAKTVSTDAFIAAWNQFGSPDRVAAYLGLNVRGVHRRRVRIEKERGIVLAAWATHDQTGRMKIPVKKIGSRRFLDVRDGIVLVGGDGHHWPGEARSTAWDAFVHLARELKPKVIVYNGDAFDGAKASHWPPTEWARQPEIKDELIEVQTRLAELESVAEPQTPLVFCVGNHDSRFSKSIASALPEFHGVPGVDLFDHLPLWSPCWALEINGGIMPRGKTIITHRWHGGVHATWNNILKGGCHYVTNHLHRCQVTTMTNDNCRLYGVDTGCLSEFDVRKDIPKFLYTESKPLNWQGGCAVLPYNADGNLLPPELCAVTEDDVAYFRGKAISMNGKKALREVPHDRR